MNATATEREREQRRALLSALLFADWHRHRQGVWASLLSIGVVAVTIGTVETTDVRTAALACLVMALGVGVGLGRGEWGEDGEEFGLSLPAPRRDRYLVRLALGTGLLLAILFLFLAAGPLGWAHAAFGRFLPGALQAEAPDVGATAGQLLAVVAASLAAHSVGFASGMATASRRDTGWLADFPIPGLLVFGGWLLDTSTGLLPVGWLSAGVSLVVAGAWVPLGIRAYERKDAVLDGGLALDCKQRRRATLVAVALGLLLLGGVAVFVAYRKATGG